MSKCPPTEIAPTTLTTLPNEVIIHTLSYLRAFDISPVQQTCRFFNNPSVIHDVVTYFVEHVYGSQFASGVTPTPLVLPLDAGSGKDALPLKQQPRPPPKHHPSKRTTKRSGATAGGSRRSNSSHTGSDNMANTMKVSTLASTTATTVGVADTTTTSTTSSLLSTSDSTLYSLAHLRSIELTVVARLLSLPEPKTGYYVSKSWIKKTLLWLETVNESTATATATTTTATSSTSTMNAASSPADKKLSKKQQRQRTRRLSDVSPPWPNANSDIVCTHHNLQRCSAKSARSRRKLMDKQAWRVLKKLYPDSTQLESKSGECVQCLLDTETTKKTEQDRLEQEKIQRKQPLSNPHVRRFYTRTKGVPSHCLVGSSSSSIPFVSNSSNINGICSPCSTTATTTNPSNRSHSVSASSSSSVCPLTRGTYVLLPRAWCHQWRKYMKTGEGSMPPPPDSSAVLCDAHKLALLPPHLEAFLHGETTHLLSSVKPSDYDSNTNNNHLSAPGAATTTSSSYNTMPPTVPVGVQQQQQSQQLPTLDIETLHSLLAAGVSQTELAAQRFAMMQLQRQQQQQMQLQQHLRGGAAAAATTIPPPLPLNPHDSSCNNDLLDRENHVVVELVTMEEWQALHETGCWPKQVSNYLVSITVPPHQSTPPSSSPSSSSSSVGGTKCFRGGGGGRRLFKDDDHDGKQFHDDDEDYYYCPSQPKQQQYLPPFQFSTSPCRDCDPTGLRFTTGAVCSTSSSKNKFRTNKRYEPKYVEQKRIPNVEY
jgi:hypothetical protein